VYGPATGTGAAGVAALACQPIAPANATVAANEAATRSFFIGRFLPVTIENATVALSPTSRQHRQSNRI
jgi:hypothetical protein